MKYRIKADTSVDEYKVIKGNNGIIIEPQIIKYSHYSEMDTTDYCMFNDINQTQKDKFYVSAI